MRTERKGAWIKNSLRGGISIRKRILFSYIIIMATALTALGVYACLQTEKRIKSNMNDSMEIVLQNKCGNIVDEVEKCNVMLMNIVRNRSVYNALCEGYDTETGSGIWSGLSDVIEPTIESFLNGSRSVDAITVYAEYEGPEVGTLLLKESRVMGEEWHKRTCEKYGIKWFCENGEVFAACEYRNIWTHNAADNSDRCGVVKISVNQRIFCINSKDKKNNYLFRVIADNGGEVYSDFAGEGIEKRSGKTVILGGKRYLCSSMEIKGTPWTLEAFVPYGSIYAGIGEIWSATAVIMLVCLVLVTALGGWLSYEMTDSIRELSRSMDEIGKGNFDTEITVTSNDEIGAIAAHMKKMLVLLNETVDNLYKTKIEKQKYELDILRTQINPHFLYNILSAIKWTAMDEDAERTEKLVSMLSTFYRTGLNDGEETICFEDELKNARAYTDMEQIIRNGRFDVEYVIDEKVYGHNCITFILQPIIENAIFHGIKPMRSGRGKVTVTARVGECIEVSVSDNGVGMSEEKRRSIAAGEGGGYGLANISRRIRLICGEKYGLTVESGEGGTTVTVRLPKDIPAPKQSRK